MHLEQFENRKYSNPFKETFPFTKTTKVVGGLYIFWSREMLRCNEHKKEWCNESVGKVEEQSFNIMKN